MKTVSTAMLFVSLLLFAASVTGQQDIVTPGAKGRDVVETVCNLIGASCVFGDDKLFTRRLAYVESFDGLDIKTFRPGYYGGIWQLDQDQFDVTQSGPASSYLAGTIAAVRTTLNIDWSTTSWTDLTKPLYSAVGARLYLQYQSRNGSIPRATDAQAQYWINYYRTSGDVNYYIDSVNRLSSDCNNAGIDMVFVLDSSGSIGSTNFEKVRQFVQSVINASDIGLDKTRVGVIQYGDTVQNIFDLNTYNDKASMLTAVRNIVYMAASTQTNIAIDYMTTVSFTEARGARPIREGHPRIGIVLTDGASNNPPLTLASAKRMHDADIIAFAIGVGTSLNMAELTAIASTPTCTYFIQLSTGFTELDSLVYAIDKMACEAPLVMPPEGGDRVNSIIPVGGSQNCQIKVSANGTTVKIAVGSGAAENDTITFYTSELTYPSESFYDQKAEGTIFHQAVVFVIKSTSGNSSIYCNYKSDGLSPTNVSIGTFPGNQNWCQSQPCQNNALCADVTTDFVCLCPAGFIGSLCEVTDDCYSQPCQNGGTCALVANGVSCSCADGFVGLYCESGDPCSAVSQPLDLMNYLGTFSSANYPGNYENDADCQWRITALEQTGVVRLLFNTFSTEHCCDFVNIHDGDNNKSSLIQSLSGSYNQSLGPFNSTQRFMYIRFRTDDSGTELGFTATYTTTKTENPCSALTQPLDLTNNVGTFSSANYPGNYDNNADCQWRITAVDDKSVVELLFNTFSTEHCCDFVYIQDGDNNKSSLIQSLSGSYSQSVGPFNTTQRYMYIRLRTDGSITGAGFTATYTSTKAEDPCSSDASPANLRNYYGILSTANYPGYYDNNADCQWRITAVDTDGLVGLLFNTFNTEECCDFVYVYDGDNYKVPLIQSLSGLRSQPVGPFNSTQRYMYIRFRSDDSVTETGFTATYTSTNTGVACSSENQPFEMPGYNGVLSSAHYPGNYDNNADCQWVLTAPDVTRIINIVFIDFTTESCCDAVTLLDGNTSKSKLLVSLAGSVQVAPEGYNSTQRYMFVRFLSDATTTAAGFRAEFTAITKD